MPNMDATLAKLAEKLGTSVEYLWPILLKKEVMDWYANTGISLLLFIIGLIITKKIWNWCKKENKEFYFDEYIPFFCSCITTFTVGALPLLIQLSHISTIFYPEATVIHNLLGK